MQLLDTSKLKVIDLSRKIVPMKEPVTPDDIARGTDEEELVWPLFEWRSKIDNAVVQTVKLKTHVKTHIESPYHLDGAGRKLSDMRPDEFLGRMVHMRFEAQEGEIISRARIEEVDGGRLKGGDIVVCHTSVSEQAPNRPRLSAEAAQYLIDKGIKLFGQDESLVTWYTDEQGFRPHDMLLKHGIPLLELMTNLDALTQDVSFLIAIPGLMKIQGIDSSTTQVVALEGLDVV